MMLRRWGNENIQFIGEGFLPNVCRNKGRFGGVVRETGVNGLGRGRIFIGEHEDLGGPGHLRSHLSDSSAGRVQAAQKTGK